MGLFFYVWRKTGWRLRFARLDVVASLLHSNLGLKSAHIIKIKQDPAGLLLFFWRKGQDSNLRSYLLAGFQDQCHQPLGHPSIYYYSMKYEGLKAYLVLKNLPLEN